MIREQLEQYKKELNTISKADEIALSIPEPEVLAFVEPLEAAGLALKQTTLYKQDRSLSERFFNKDKPLLLLRLNGGFDTTTSLFRKLGCDWTEGSASRQKIAHDYIKMQFLSGNMLIDIDLFKDKELADELISLQHVILESHYKASTYNNERCAAALSKVFNVDISPPYGMGTIRSRAAYNHYITDALRSRETAHNAASKINKEFNQLGMYNDLKAIAYDRNVDLQFNMLEHQDILEKLNEHTIDLAPILKQAEKERRESLNPFKRGLEDIREIIFG